MMNEDYVVTQMLILIILSGFVVMSFLLQLLATWLQLVLF